MTRARRSSALAFVVAGCLWAGAARARDKSGVRPNVISVPSGPGTISGLGEQFRPDANTGSAVYRVALEVPAGTAGLAPALALDYDSGRGSGQAGFGWSLDAGSIQRQTDKGVPRYAETDRYLLDGREIVPVGGGVFRLETEGAFLRARRTAAGWEVDGKDGSVSRYGVSEGGRSAGPEGAFRWALEQVVDVFGNRIAYSYERDRGQLYLVKIEYNLRPGAARNEVICEYEPRADALVDFRAGYPVTTGRRLRRVRMLASGRQIRRYELAYDPGSTLSRLASVRMFGSDDRTALPAVSFGYSGFEPGKHMLRAITGGPAFSLRSPDVELADFDGDGLPDLVHATLAGHEVAYNRGDRFLPAVRLPSNPSVELSSPGVELADLDGDGLVDLVAKLAPGAGDFYYLPNRGRGRWEDRIAFRQNPDFAFEEPGARMLDLDGDGLVDVMRTTSSATYAWRNNGDGSWTALPPAPPIPDVSFSDPQVKLADMNGDRLIDIATLRSGSLVYRPGMGYGRWGDAVAVPGAPDAGADEERLLLADVSGDGLADVALVVGTAAQFWLQDGAGKLSAPVAVSGLPEADPAKTRVRLCDMNGSGTTDVLWNGIDASRWTYLDLSGGVRPNLLVTIDNGLGRKIEIGYSSTGEMVERGRRENEPWSTRLPIPVQVVSQVVTTDGRGWRNEKRFEYRDGHYDGATRQFRGFGRTIETEPGGEDEAASVVLHEYDLGLSDEALKGTERSREVRDDRGAVLRKTTSGYEARSYAMGTDGRRVAGPLLLWQETAHVEGGDRPVVTRESYAYDDHGNVTLHAAWGIVEGQNLLAGKDERLSSAEYANDPGRWLLGRPVRQTVHEAAAAGPGAMFGRKLSETRIYYDGEPFVGLPLGRLGERGAPSRSEGWVDGERFSPIDRVQRDDFGLVTAILDGRGNRREVDYDAQTHRFPVAERIMLGGGRKLEMTAGYDQSRGVIEWYKDPAGRETRFVHNALFQLAAIYKPGDPDGKPTVAFEYVYGAPLSKVVTRSRTKVGGDEAIEKHHHSDGLGRDLGLVEQAEDGKTVVSGLKAFGPRGHVVREVEPFFARGFDLPAASPASFTGHKYDALGRRTRSVLPDGSASESRFSPMAVERWDAEDLDLGSKHKNTPRTERLTALGVSAVQERLGARMVETTWHRDGLGRIERVVDAAGNETRIAYDGLGRTVERIHPDAGRTTFGYDEAGNLLWQKDARGARVEHPEYDAANRPLLRRLVDRDGKEEESVRYHYDAPSPLFPDDRFTAGELTWVADGAGEEHFRHDGRGRLVELVRKVDGKQHRLANELDALDRLVRVSYPSGRSLDHQYGGRGFLRAAPGVIKHVEYDAEGLVLRREHANGTQVVATYDPMNRLRSLASLRGSSPFSSLGYKYDRVGNPGSITDEVRPSGAMSATRSFEYDDLYRLTGARGADRSWSYDFDAVGNFKTKTLRASEPARPYTLERAHRAKDIGGGAVAYDDAGNIIERPGFAQAFDARGRLKSVTGADGTVVTYRYDAGDACVVKETRGPKGARRVVYIDRLAEERDGQLMEYVFAGDQRVARLGPPARGGAAAGLLRALPAGAGLAGLALFVVGAALGLLARGSRPARAAVAMGMSVLLVAAGCGGDAASMRPDAGAPDGGASAAAVFYHPDHLGGVAAQTGSDGALVAEGFYDPFGAALTATRDPYAFGAKELDGDTGLYEFGARAYDPALGLFLSPDPAILGDPELAESDPQLLNPYAYTRNTPTAYIDPDGRLPHVLVGAGVGAAIGGGAYLVKAAFTGDFSWRGLFSSTAGGAVAGTIAAATGGASLLVQGAASGIGGGLVQRAIETRSVSETLSPRAIATDTVLGLAGGAVAKAATGALAKHARASAKPALARPQVAGTPARDAALGQGEGPTAAGGGLRRASTWGRPGTLADHFRRHGGGVGARTAEEYAEAASNLLRRSQAERLPTKIDPEGIIRVYDPRTNTFGAYNPSGTTRTFFKPTRGQAYWADQPGGSPWTP